jgi:hypothetical protein
MECYYGCGQEANFLIKSTNKWCCSKSVNSCPEQRRKNSLGVRSKSKLIGKKISEHWKNNDYPLKGKDHFTDSRIHTKYYKNDFINKCILIKNSLYSTSQVKSIFRKDKSLYCLVEKCSHDRWEGEELQLELHHKNGVSNDHRIQNLIFLCPNCHSLTKNFGSKNKNGYKKIYSSITRERMIEAVSKSKSIREVLQNLSLPCDPNRYYKIKEIAFSFGINLKEALETT